MATIILKRNRYQVQIRRAGEKPVYRTFTNKKTAQIWARKAESDIERGLYLDSTQAQRTQLGALLDRYQQEILPTKRSQNAVRGQIKVLRKFLGNLPLTAITPSELSEYRDKRLQSVANQTVRHELSLIQRVLNIAVKDWGIHLPHGNPVEKIRLPAIPKGRDRRPTFEELEKLEADPVIGAYVVLAVETGLRRSEIARIKLEVELDTNTSLLSIPVTKNGSGRIIPVSERAIAALRTVSKRKLKPDSITQAFLRACHRNAIQGLTFHDLRHEATSRLFEKGLNPVEVATITGHKDTRMLMRYTHIRPETLLHRIS